MRRRAPHERGERGDRAGERGEHARAAPAPVRRLDDRQRERADAAGQQRDAERVGHRAAVRVAGLAQQPPRRNPAPRRRAPGSRRTPAASRPTRSAARPATGRSPRRRRRPRPTARSPSPAARAGTPAAAGPATSAPAAPRPTACSTRAPTSTSADGASPHSAEAAMNSAEPARRTAAAARAGPRAARPARAAPRRRCCRRSAPTRGRPATRPGTPPDRRERDVDDRHVQEGHEHGHGSDEQDLPATIELLHATHPTRPRCMTLRSTSCSVAPTTVRTARSRKALELVGERWTMLVLREAFTGRRRFDEMADDLGIARNVLTAASAASSRRACWRRSATRSAPSASSTA